MRTLAFYFTGNRFNWFLAAAAVAGLGLSAWLAVLFLCVRNPRRWTREPFQSVMIVATAALIIGGFATLIVWGVQSDWDATRDEHIKIERQLTRDYQTTVAVVHSTDLNNDHAQDSKHDGGVVYYRLRNGKECSADLHEDHVVGWTITKPHCATYQHGDYPGAQPRGGRG